MKRIMLLTFSLSFVLQSAFAGDNNDWRKTASDREKLQNVIEVMPGASTLMLQMGERYRNLYWAAKQGKWEFADYQLEEMQDLVETLVITRPKRATTAKRFLETGFKQVSAAVEEKNWKAFRAGFADMRAHCMTCHKDNDHDFIILNQKPPKGNSPVLD